MNTRDDTFGRTLARRRMITTTGLAIVGTVGITAGCLDTDPEDPAAPDDDVDEPEDDDLDEPDDDLDEPEDDDVDEPEDDDLDDPDDEGVDDENGV